MTVETESILIKLLEELKSEVKETNKKLDKFIETTNESFTDIKVNQARQDEQIKALQKGQDTINDKLKIQNTWLLSLITGLVIGVLTLITAIGKVVFFPNP